MQSPSLLSPGLVAILVLACPLRAQEAPAPAPAALAQESPAPPPPQRPRMPSGPVEVNGIAAKVNGKVITKNEISFMLAPVYGQLASQFPRRGSEFERQMKAARDGIVQELVDRQIILTEFNQIQKDKGAGIKDQFIDEEIKRQIRELFNGDEAKFQLELKRSHLTMDGYRKMTKDKMIVQAMRANQFADAPPPLPSEIREEYDAIKLTLRDTSKDRISFKKIFIPRLDPENPSSPPDAQLTLAEGLARQLSQGKDFAALAKLHSRDAFAAQGGAQLNVPRSDLSPEFAASIFDAKPGQLLGPLADPNGFTLVIPTKIDYGPVPALDGKISEMIQERVRRKKTSAQYERWIISRRKRAMIDIRPM